MEIINIENISYIYHKKCRIKCEEHGRELIYIFTRSNDNNYILKPLCLHCIEKYEIYYEIIFTKIAYCKIYYNL